jgi:hypothetical protein
MKEKEASVECESHQMTVFVEKEDGSYGPMQTGSFMVKKYIDEFWKKTEHFKNSALTQLLKNEISPIGFYMLLRDMAPADVASRIGINTAQVKKHMLPGHFGTLKLTIARKYAEIFGIPVANLFQVNEKTGFVGPSIIKQNATRNPFVVLAETGNGE